MGSYTELDDLMRRTLGHDEKGNVNLEKLADIVLNKESSINNHEFILNGPVVNGAGKFGDHPIDERRTLKVAVIGAGLSGVTAGILLPVKCPGIDLTIIDKNNEVGGTWLENIYPGVRCDIPAHAYQSTFAPNTQWTEEYAQGPEILKYWQGLAKRYNVYQYIKFGTLVKAADWDDHDATWTLKTENLASGEQHTTKYDVLITAIGHFNAWRLPDYPGLKDFEGHLRHSSNWDPAFDPRGKRVAVIGNGSSGIQVVPNLQKVAGHIDHYARSQTWITGSWANEKQERTLEPIYFSPERLESFHDPKEYLAYRKSVENKLWRRFGTLFKDSTENQALRDQCVKLMREKLATRPDILEQLLPTFAPTCRRLTPGPGYLEALTQPNVSFITTPIERFTSRGIKTVDGTEREVDAIICSTGANVDFVPQFPIRARGVDLSKAWRPDGVFGFPYTYLGMATPNFPNLFFVWGPSSSGYSGTVPVATENQITYFAKVIRKLASQGIRTISPLPKAADDFVEFSDDFFSKTVLMDGCSSWYNGGRPGARIHGMFPGSAAAANQVRREPRWEDYEYTYVSGTGNRFAYFGNGWTKKEKEQGSDLTPYLKLPGEIDLRTYHENWFEV